MSQYEALSAEPEPVPVQIERWSNCERCKTRIPYPGRGRPARFCNFCRFDIVSRAKDADRFGNGSCVVCNAPLALPEFWRRARLTCGDACRQFLARLRAELAA